MGTHRVQNLMVSADTAVVAGGLAINPTNVTAGKLAFAGEANVTLTAGDTVADSDSLIIYQYIAANGALKRTAKIPANYVTKYKAEAYAPATRKVVAIGYNRKTAAGSIVAANSTEYEFSIVINSDKQLYSTMLFKKTFQFVSAAAATQATIAAQIASAINGDEYLKKMVTALVVNSGGNYGVEITGKVLAQATGSYAIETPDFDVFLNDTLGFSTTTNGVISTAFQGVGSYQALSNLEKFLIGYEGKMNFTTFPIPSDNLLVSSTANLSSAIAGTGNVGVTNASDVVTFATTNAALVPGDLVELDGANYEIKFLIGTTSAILTENFTGSTTATSVLKKRQFYDMIVIEFSNPNLNDGAALITDNKQSVIIAVPAATTGAAYNATSTAGASIQAILNPWMNSLGFASISL